MAETFMGKYSATRTAEGGVDAGKCLQQGLVQDLVRQLIDKMPAQEKRRTRIGLDQECRVATSLRLAMKVRFSKKVVCMHW